MKIFLNVLFLIIGMALLIKGADLFVSGASAVAKKLKVPSMFIGLTIVALGTSLPELSISLAGAIKHTIDMSVGNIVGSNMINMLLILGIVALIKPVPVKKSSKKIDFPFLIGITLLLLVFSADKILNGADINIITRSESLLLLVVLALYMVILIFNVKTEHKLELEKQLDMEFSCEETKEVKPKKVKKELKVWQIIIFIILGLGGVIFGAECVSTTSQFLALKIGMSEALVGLTVVAIGTSLPELTTSIIAAKKGENELALGNILGSNVINIALVLGMVGSISQIPVSNTILIDLVILTACTIIFSTLCMFKDKISRWKGGIFVAMYLAYMTFAIIRNYCF